MTMREKLVLLQQTEAANAERLKIWKGYTKYEVHCYDSYGNSCVLSGYWASPEDIRKELAKYGYHVVKYWRA